MIQSCGSSVLRAVERAEESKVCPPTITWFIYLLFVCLFVCWSGKRQRVFVTLSLHGEGTFKRMVSQVHMYKSQTLTEGWLCLLHYTWHQLILCSCSVHKHLLTCGLHTRAFIWVRLYLNICMHTDRYCVYMCIWIYMHMTNLGISDSELVYLLHGHN